MVHPPNISQNQLEWQAKLSDAQTGGVTPVTGWVEVMAYFCFLPEVRDSTSDRWYLSS